MKIHYLSDIHVDQRGGNVPASLFSVKGEVLIIAGDWCSFEEWNTYYHLLERLCLNFNQVFIVAGNHEYYGTSINTDVKKVKVPVNCMFLNREMTEYKGIKIFGGTYWPYIPVNDRPRIENVINDFRCIYYGANNKRISSTVLRTLHNRFVYGLSMCSPDIVVSHMPPTELSIAEKYKNNPLNTYFVNRGQIIKGKFWVCGHVHHRHEYKVQDTHVLCNPLGYSKENFYEHEFTPKEFVI